MDFAQSFHNQNSVLNISVMVVDDDPVFLQIMSRMLEKSQYRDPSVMEITVIAVKNSMEALSTLKTQRSNIDLIVTDYYMPGMNGLQLKSEITRKFGNLPVIVISSDSNIEQESLTCGAMCFFPKPIKPIDLTKIYQLALTYKKNGKAILWTDHQNHAQQIQLFPEQVNVLMMTNNNKCLSKEDSRSVSTDGSNSRKIQRTKPNGGSSTGHALDHQSMSRPCKKRKIKWTDFLHDRFLQAIRHIGLDKAVPKKILEFMNVPHLTRENVASHLQKYRIFLRKVAEKCVIHSNAWSDRDIQSMFPDAHMTELYNNYFKQSSSWYDTSLNDRSFYSRTSHGLGQSRLLSNTRAEPSRFKQIPNYNYMNRSSSTYHEPRFIGSNLTLPSKPNFSNQPSQNEARRSIFEPMVNKINQSPQVLGFGQNGVSNINGNNFNNKMVGSFGGSSFNHLGASNYESLTPNQPRLNNYESLNLDQPRLNNYDQSSSTLNQLGLSNYGSLTLDQPRLNNCDQSSSTLNQLGLSNYGSLTLDQPRLNNYDQSSTLNQLGLSNYGSLAPNNNHQLGLINYGSSSTIQAGLNNYGGSLPTQYEILTPNQSRLDSTTFGSLAPNNQSRFNSFGSSTLNQPELESYGSLTSNQQGLSSFETSTPSQLGLSNFSYGMQSFLNNENIAYNPDHQEHANATTQPNLDVTQLENLNLYDDLAKIVDLPCNISNFQFDQNKQQGVTCSNTEFEFPGNFSTELNQLFSTENGDDDLTLMNINQVHSNGEMSNTFAAMETNSTTSNINSNYNQEQEIPDFIDWSLVDTQDLVDEDFMNSLFNKDMN